MDGGMRSRALGLACALALCLGALPYQGALAADSAERYSDLWLKASLVTTYTLNQHLNPFDIDVDVKDGVATLRGTVDSGVEKDLAAELALGIDGIRKVDNRLQIQEGAAQPHEGSFMQRVNDANITAKVKSQLLWNSNTQGMQIDVDTENGVVTLRGTVASAAEADLATQIARNTSGVVRVDNQLTANPGRQSAAHSAEQTAAELQGEFKDAWITTKVKTSLLYNRGVDAASIDVRTEHGTVTLSGVVADPYEIKRAEQIARGIVGVREVHNELREGRENGH